MRVCVFECASSCTSASGEREKNREPRRARQHTHSKHLLCKEVTVLFRVVRALAVARVLTLAVRTHKGYFFVDT